MALINKSGSIPISQNNRDDHVADVGSYKGKKAQTVSPNEKTLDIKKNNSFIKKITKRKMRIAKSGSLNVSNVKKSKQAKENIATIKKIKSTTESYKKFHEQDENNNRVTKNSVFSKKTTELLDSLQDSLDKYNSNSDLSSDFDKTTKDLINSTLASISDDLDLTLEPTKRLVELKNSFVKEKKNQQNLIEKLVEKNQLVEKPKNLYNAIESSSYYENKKELYNEVLKFRKQIPDQIKKLDKEIAKSMLDHSSSGKDKSSDLINKKNDLKKHIIGDT